MRKADGDNWGEVVVGLIAKLIASLARADIQFVSLKSKIPKYKKPV